MKAQILQLPDGALCGQPPRRLFEQLAVFEDGTIVALGAMVPNRETQRWERKRSTVFDDKKAVILAFGINGARFDSWMSQAEETTVDFVGCRDCRRCVPPATEVSWEDTKAAHAAGCTWVRQNAEQ